ncbi:hypothetical protein K443DRAFT_674326 [Laccaria amethystina LaAM-08-1]|uniref:Yeast cell wall synthesis Kre9/Knh1-like N-terminal domain-containing protein n=1 Tax=Laccaria amethystina LaAM-08-1 TaxID=1095629 RepID=A0A0C9XML4_9AGAR|nr:hypothetical protein K443DRAFT_674326 [Laccaria amethystina LaAM-08-1]
MRPSNLFSKCINACFVLTFLANPTSSYFIITEPAAGRQWVNGATNLVTWEKGVLDGIYGFDIEMARMSQDGLMKLARNVPSASNAINIQLQDVPAGDDYFLIFINSTHGVMYASSSRFTILAASSTPTSPAPSPDAKVSTVAVSGGPNPTAQFATTFPAIASAAAVRWEVGMEHLAGLLSVTIGVVFGATWTLLW